MPAVSARSIFATSGRSVSRQASERRRRRGRRARPAHRACGAHRPCRAAARRSGQRSGRTISMQMRPGSVPRRPTIGQVVRTEDSTSRHGARVEVDEQHLALGQQRHADLQRRRAGAVVEGEQRVVGLGGGQQLAAADLDGAELAAHQRLAAERRARGAGRRSAGSAGVICPCERNSGNQSVRRRSSSVSAGIGSACSSAAHGEQARALGLRERAEQLLEAVLPAGAGELEALDGDVALDRLGGHVLDLVEHGRTVRQERHAVGGVEPGSSPRVL